MVLCLCQQVTIGNTPHTADNYSPHDMNEASSMPVRLLADHYDQWHYAHWECQDLVDHLKLCHFPVWPHPRCYGIIFIPRFVIWYSATASLLTINTVVMFDPPSLSQTLPLPSLSPYKTYSEITWSPRSWSQCYNSYWEAAWQWNTAIFGNQWPLRVHCLLLCDPTLLLCIIGLVSLTITLSLYHPSLYQSPTIITLSLSNPH